MNEDISFCDRTAQRTLQKARTVQYFLAETNRYKTKCINLRRLPVSYHVKVASKYYMDKIFELKVHLVQQYNRENISIEQAQLIMDNIFLQYYDLDKRIHHRRTIAHSKLDFGYKIFK